MTVRRIALSVTIERKRPDLPRYAVIPSAVLIPWALSGTAVVEVTLNDRVVKRRTIKKWDADRWFLSITEDDCRRLGVNTGDKIDITLELAATSLPKELAQLLTANEHALVEWERRTTSQQRMLREEIAAAKRPETRTRRARKALLGE
jgi:Bacteriocin-protection, YdeI or OmpD-Associated